ncbi:protein NO VEIN isoform X2 [Cryptomeria japonica]|nr:protein NO VEIN isoform X2 [Cryptomeria japonica]
MMELQGTVDKKGRNLLMRNMKKLSKLFTMEPAVSLLNVAVISMKMGLWDTFLELNKQEGIVTGDAYSREEKVQNVEDKSHFLGVKNGLSSHEVVQQVIKFFEVNPIENARGGELATEEQFIMLRKIWHCERWLVSQFSVQDFACLGFGDFLSFLETHLCEFPQKIRKILTAHECRDSPLIAYVATKQLLGFLSQAVWDLGGDAILTKEEFSVLLHKQFPFINFEMSDSASVEGLMNCITKFRSHSQKRNTGYSAALLARSSLIEKSRFNSHGSGEASEFLPIAGALGHMSSDDAIKCLLKAPMLSDLGEWSHWDHVFAPTLGPILSWLEKEASSDNLICLVTRNGKLLRIDGSATMDEFLAAVMKGCAKETAIQFVSIVALFGGMQHAPIALMKSHAAWGIDVLVKNFVDQFEHAGILDMGKMGYCINCRKSLIGDRNFGCDSGQTELLQNSHISTTVTQTKFSEKSQNIEKTAQVMRVAARFILDFLGHLPPEFRTFAGQIFLSGLGTLSAAPSQIILHECVVSDERLMLHEIGLSIGIVEWINDYQDFSIDLSHAVQDPLECQVRKNDMQINEQHDTECESETNQLEGSHCLNVIGRKKKSFQKLQLEDVNDPGVLQTKLNEFAISMPENEGSLSQEDHAKGIIESIRCEEFGLDLKLQSNETNLLKRQHARLGRALHCLSQELYSQDSHFLLELVQNADDNLYPSHVEPTLAFVLQSTCVVVLNNELGFTAKDIKALCDVGNSTKKGSSAGYIGHKGIGFKSVFRVTDAPEIHSNGFHVKFDVSEGELGFILPTLVAPLSNLHSISKELSNENNELDDSVWKTCIVLPFKGSFLKGIGIRSWVSKFADLHPSLLLFLHRLRCIKIRDSVTNSLNIMRREDVGNGLVKVSHGKESTTWLMASRKLNAGSLRSGVQITEIAMAFTLCEDQSGEYRPCLENQPVFAFLPLRAYGLKFILQGDFILPSSREEVDGDSAWNQWLLSEFPDLFVSAAVSFRDLPCYQSNLGKAVTLYMRFVPLIGEVLGFFSPLPGMILSKLRASSCLPLESKDISWSIPCKVLRGWSDQLRMLLPDDLLNNHLGLGYLHRDVHLTDPLANTLGVHAYGPRTLIEMLKSLCNNRDDLRDLGLNWLGSLLSALYDCLRHRPDEPNVYFEVKQESDCLSDLCMIPFIPLSDGSYSSLVEGAIWLPCDSTEAGIDAHVMKKFPKLYSEIRTVHSSLFFTPSTVGDIMVRDDSDVIVRMLRYVGVGQLSAHEVVMTHILQAMSMSECMSKDKIILTEYLAFIMLHLQSNCSLCYLEREKLISELRKKAIIVTKNGLKVASSEPLHFSTEFGNPIDMRKILSGTNLVWNEIDSVYLKFFSTELHPSNLSQWRIFFKELGVTDFVQILNVKKNVDDQSCTIWRDLAWEGSAGAVRWTVNDWESPELVEILTVLSSSCKTVEQCSCLLKVLDEVWDDVFGAKKATYWSGSPGKEEGKQTEASCVLQIRGYRWIKSKLDDKLYFPTNLFFECDDVKSILGSHVPYASPQVHNKKLVADIGLKTQVSVKDALNLLFEWSKSGRIFKASTYQMRRLYSFLWTRMDTCGEEVAAHFGVNSSIFVPLVDELNMDDVAEGIFLSLDQVYWRDQTGSLDLLKKRASASDKIPFTDKMCLGALCQIYPNLQYFFVNKLSVQESPDFDGYVRILQNLSRVVRPSEAYKEVIQVLYKWAEDIESERVDSKEISRWKGCLHDLDCSVLPTIQDKWVSLHQQGGLVCWCDDVELGKQFRSCHGIYFLHLNTEGKFNKIRGKDGIPSKVLTLMRTMGIPSLSEVVVREAIYYGHQDSKQIISLINWILPYAQRYLHRMHPEVYWAVKDNIFSSESNRLLLLLVEKLFYRHTLHGCDSVSNKRYECSCLLEGNTLYVSREAEYSAIYLELSRLFFKGCVNLQLANFLHLITIMAKSGSTEEQTESSIMDAQEIPKLPQEEALWFCEHGYHSDKNVLLTSANIPENYLTSKKSQKLCVDASWPPTTWFGAPSSQDEVLPHVSHSEINQDVGRSNHSIDLKNVSSSKSAYESDQSIDTFKASTITVTPHNSKIGSDTDITMIKREGESSIAGKDDLFLEPSLAGLGNADIGLHSQNMSASEETNVRTSCIFSNRNKLFWGGTDDDQRQLTGRLGEYVVYKYLTEKYGLMSVNWVNEKEETGSPFDMILSKADGKKEFIEVKATRSENKDWFEITTRELEFASKNSECFTIIRVFLTLSQSVKFVLLANPIKLCQQKFIKLVILTPTNQQCVFPEVSFMPQGWDEIEASRFQYQ